MVEHVAEWNKSLLDEGVTEAYARLSDSRVLCILDAIEAAVWFDLDLNRVSGFLAERRARGLSVETSNHYLRRITQFGRWMVKDRRAADSPLVCLKLMNAQTDRRHDRRAFTDDELHRLFVTARRNRRKSRTSGPDRARLYRLAAETGLRAREIGRLTPESFRLDEDHPTVVIAAA